jgi:tungstate transport system substrate-binding protein
VVHLRNARPRAVPTRRVLLGWALAALAGTMPGCRPTDAGALTMATTTSVGHSGLLDVLLPAFRTSHGLAVQSHLVGSGRALVMLDSGAADLVISHAPDAEAAALRTHPGWTYRKIMYNDFVLVGPSDDPAGVRGAPAASEAMRRIARSNARFISRGDESGTHERERQLWRVAGAAPENGRLVTAGAGMGSTLRVASQTGAYTLTDRATFGQHRASLALEVLFEGGADLLNTYAVIVNAAGRRGAGARAFADWMASGGGRDVIERYRVGGDTRAFRPWPAGRAATRPEDLPL